MHSLSDCSAGAIRNRLSSLRTKLNKEGLEATAASSNAKGGASMLSTPTKSTDDIVARTPSRSSSGKSRKTKAKDEFDIHEDDSATPPKGKKRKVDEVNSNTQDADDEDDLLGNTELGGNKMDPKTVTLEDDDDDF